MELSPNPLQERLKSLRNLKRFWLLNSEAELWFSVRVSLIGLIFLLSSEYVKRRYVLTIVHLCRIRIFKFRVTWIQLSGDQCTCGPTISQRRSLDLFICQKSSEAILDQFSLGHPETTSL